MKEIVISAKSSTIGYWKELWNFRELFVYLTWRDIIVRYKQTVIGILWSVLRPIITMLVFTIVFGNIAKLPSEGEAPYALMVFAALLPWQLFSNAVQESSNSLINNADMITKIYFPRMILPASSVIVAIIDFFLACLILACMMVYYGFYPDIKILLLPFFMLLSIITALGVGLIVSSLNVTYRDFRYIIPFIIQFGLYISPVGFSSSVIPDEYRFIYSLNPMVGVIDGFRWCLLNQDVAFYWPGFLTSIGITVITFIVGIRIFRKMEKTFADKI
jgi:lipopolysaccharide transport system permease protein